MTVASMATSPVDSMIPMRIGPRSDRKPTPDDASACSTLTVRGEDGHVTARLQDPPEVGRAPAAAQARPTRPYPWMHDGNEVRGRHSPPDTELLTTAEERHGRLHFQ